MSKPTQVYALLGIVRSNHGLQQRDI
jgi:hypothetical protein